MPISEIIEQALGSPSKIRVLRFLKKPGACLMSIRQMAQFTSLNAVTLARTLRDLKEIGVVDYVQAGRSQLWRIMPSYATVALSPILDQLMNLPSLSEIISHIINSATPIPAKVREIILFGSAASDEAQASSDIDLCLILQSVPRTLEVDKFCDQLHQKVSEELGMRLAPIFITKNRFHQLKEPLRSNIKSGISLYAKNKDTSG
jgi:DNA-binding transcriptional regulator YhcF (GntR family)